LTLIIVCVYPRYMASESLIVADADAPRIERGARVPAAAKLAVVVMAINADPRVADAVASLMAQDVPLETIVVNTGGPTLRPQLADYLDRIILVEADALRLPGGTRNLGIEATTAPVVAFLAADCMAPSGWARARLVAHEAGSRAVASALRPAPDRSGRVPLASWASYALLHARRAPEFPAEETARYGASYNRELFDKYGRFREDLRIGEDTEFNERVAADAPLAWAPAIVTLHRYPTTIAAGSRDAFDRGANLYRWFRARRRFALYPSLARTAGSWLVARQLRPLANAEARTALRRAAPLVALFAFLYAVGAITAAAIHPLRRRS
jgi:GT2 family glycosyltransferase